METNFKSKTFLATLIILGGLVSVPLSFIEADSGVSLYVTPSSGIYEVGDSIKVSVKIDTKGETINAVKATLSFNENLKVQSISESGSILGLWAPGEEPAYDNSSRTITFGGAGVGTTYEGSAGKIISITFKAEKNGKGTITFSSSVVKYGATTIDVDSATGGSYTINVSCNCTSWQDKACGGNGCSSGQRFQTRTCTPSGCALGNQCVSDSSCVSQPSQIEGEEEEITEEAIQEEEGVIEEPSEKETVSKEGAVQKSLLAGLVMVWGGTSQLALMMVIIVLCVVTLVSIGIKELRLYRKKKRKL